MPVLQLPLLLCLACAAVPAWAADSPCSGGGSTDQGIEDGEGATGENSTCAPTASAYGYASYAGQPQSSAFGFGNIAGGTQSNVFGYLNAAGNALANAIGGLNEAFGYRSNAFGVQNRAYGENASAFGFDNNAAGSGASAFGYDNTALSIGSSAFGHQSQALNYGSTAIGYQAIADRDYAVSVGQAGAEHQIIHLADGTADTDAVNLRQLNAAVLAAGSYTGWSLTADGGVSSEAIGDGETVAFEADDANGNLTVSRSGKTITYGFSATPTFDGLTVGGGGGSFTVINNTVVNLGGNVVGGVADGVAATDAVNRGQLDAAVLAAGGGAQAALDAANAAQGTANTAVAAAANAQSTADNALVAAATAQATANTALGRADAAQATADTALATAGAAVDTANDYTDTREAAVRDDMAAADAETLATSRTYADTRSSAAVNTANAYTDSRMAAWNETLDLYRQEVDLRFAGMDQRIDRVAAMSGAMSAAAMNTAGLPGQNRVGIGVSTQNGRAAMAVGYQRLVAPNASISLGGAFSGGDGSLSAGAGFSW
ncbi:MAG: YadA-like family protein [Pseudomonadota bacterium]|nr:YadA-like family protein [Pseudomonadota bacterium]